MDADAHNSLGGQYGVRGFPTIKVNSSRDLRSRSFFDIFLRSSVLIRGLRATIRVSFVRKNDSTCPRICDVTFPGARTAQAIADAALGFAKQLVQARLSGRAGGGGGGGGGSSSGGSGGQVKYINT